MQLTDIRSRFISAQDEFLLSGFNIIPFCINVLHSLATKERNTHLWRG